MASGTPGPQRAAPDDFRGDSWVSESPEATESRGSSLAASLEVGDVIVLTGPLGAGKTRFVHGLARGLAARGRVRSPSFTLVLEYHGRIPLFHLDLYRLDESDVPGLGLEELAERGALVVEWGERLPAAWRAEALTIEFVLASETRRDLTASAVAGRGLELEAAWRACSRERGADRFEQQNPREAG